jgi:hypothetical protein
LMMRGSSQQIYNSLTLQAGVHLVTAGVVPFPEEA